MSVSSTTTKNSYSANGTAHSFAYGFKIFADADLSVVVRSSTGTETTKTLNTHYIITNAGNEAGGNVLFKFNTGDASDAHYSGTDQRPANGETVVITRSLTLTQGTDYVANDAFPAESHEDALDRLTMITQQIQEEVDRSVKASVTNTFSSSEFTVSATDRANKVFSFDGSGDLSVTQELGTFKGNWAASTAYVVRDIVKDTSTNNIFIAITAHTSSGSQPLTTNTDSSKWSLIVDAATATSAQTAAASSASSASTSASTATTKASEASTSAATASTQAGIATAKAVLTAADATSTAADVVSTNADVVTTNADAATTTADRAQVNTDKGVVAADKATVAADKATVATDKAAAATSASSASTSAATATTKAAEASTSASNASTSETNSASSATASASSATAASNSQAAAATSATSAASSAAAAQAAANFEVVNDTSPQLGGNLDLNSNDITGTGNIDVTGTVTADGLDVQGDGTISGGSRLTISNIADVNNDGIRLDDNTTSRFNNLTQDTSGNFKIQHWTGSAWQNNLTLTTGGNLGIGTSSSLKTSGSGVSQLQIGGSGSPVFITAENGTTNRTAISAGAYKVGTNWNTGWDYANSSGEVAQIGVFDGDVLFRYAASGTEDAAITWSERMRIDGSTGYLLVGKTSSNIGTAGSEVTPLYISATRANNSPLFLNLTGNDGSLITFRKDNAEVGTISCYSNELAFVSGNTGLYFDDANNQIYPLNGSGSVRDNITDLGTIGSRFKRGYFGSTVFAAGIGGIGDQDTYINFANNNIMEFYTSGSPRATLTTNRFLIGKTSTGLSNTGHEFSTDGFVYHVRNGNIMWLNTTASSANAITFMQNSGGVGSVAITSSGTTYNTTSDIRLKQDIEPLEATDKLMQMNPVSYAWKADPDGPRSMGFIANEMIEVMPEAVSTGDDDEAMMSMDYGRITPILVSALQDAHKKIEELESRIAAMESK